jgi:hypothetical protein
MDFHELYASPLLARSAPTSWRAIHQAQTSQQHYADLNESFYSVENAEPSPASISASSLLPVVHFTTPGQASTSRSSPFHLQNAQQQHQASLTPKKSDLRRGRPRADAISHLIMKGSTSKSSIKCPICARVFPREKSLQAHLRTHTGKFYIRLLQTRGSSIFMSKTKVV